MCSNKIKLESLNASTSLMLRAGNTLWKNIFDTLCTRYENMTVFKIVTVRSAGNISNKLKSVVYNFIQNVSSPAILLE